MKIDISPKYNLFHKTSGTGATQAGASAPAMVKQDVISITHGNTSTDKATLSMKAGVHSYLAAPADPARLAALRDEIRGGTYRVDTDDLVESILKG